MFSKPFFSSLSVLIKMSFCSTMLFIGMMPPYSQKKATVCFNIYASNNMDDVVAEKKKKGKRLLGTCKYA